MSAHLKIQLLPMIRAAKRPLYTAEKSNINLHEFHVGPGLLVRDGIVLV